jgi:hypothetical protein
MGSSSEGVVWLSWSCTSAGESRLARCIISSLPESVSDVERNGDLWQDDWEALGIEKRTDYENLWRVFERICGAKRNHFDAKDLAHAFKCVTQSARMCVRVFGVC